VRSWRTVNNRKRPGWRMIGGEYVRHSRALGVIWHPEFCWNGEKWPAAQQTGEA
jgi:hypothetical protein